jgi:hypothetical protein
VWVWLRGSRSLTGLAAARIWWADRIRLNGRLRGDAAAIDDHHLIGAGDRLDAVRDGDDRAVARDVLHVRTIAASVAESSAAVAWSRISSRGVRTSVHQRTRSLAEP